MIQGYKSIADCDLRLRPINVLVGANGAGKSNFVSALGLLGSIVNEDLQLAVARAGGGSALLHGAPKRSRVLMLQTYFGSDQYEARLVPGVRDPVGAHGEACFTSQSSDARGLNRASEKGS